ncbi:PREDICTED: uncharacterized protein LOC101294425 [Fragaria vesca subsp. vesca]|uniref:uncharacterized protein LOC101294425 n=1 Tax=Fragaria vesca subsp. vesca TaxID=101020 RepID=UPI0002C36466|nr:PREDICTED: uncharacterized protein LOC101294425 [Fragaria vesca subsp. vesca]
MFLVVSSSFNEIKLVNTKRLSHVIIHKLDSPPEATVNSQGNLVKFFSVLSSVQVLTIVGHFMKPCLHLCTLSICTNMTNPDQMLASLCRMRSCPTLQDLELRAPDGEESGLAVAKELSGRMDTYRSMFNQLSVITLKNVTDLNVEREYIRLLLLCTPVLQRMALVQGWECCCSLHQWLVSCDRASVCADIVCQNLCATNVSLGAE